MTLHWKPYALAAALVTLVAATVLSGAKYNSVIQIGMKAPSFSNLPGIDGKTYSLPDFKEDAVVLVFLANHCPWVRGGEKDLIKIVDDFKGKSVRFIGLGVNLRQDDALPAMKERAAKVGYNLLYLHDPTQEIGRKYGATRTPEYFVLNKERKVIYAGLLTNSPALIQSDGSSRYVNGEPKDFYVRDAINAALAGKPAPVAETRAQGCTVEYSGR
ncbi:MAG: thioredoxin family protein [Acidobacteria bacterium]|nr:thioredoxin family protein [Acidobacteriota bacterium]